MKIIITATKENIETVDYCMETIIEVSGVFTCTPSNERALRREFNSADKYETKFFNNFFWLRNAQALEVFIPNNDVKYSDCILDPTADYAAIYEI